MNAKSVQFDLFEEVAPDTIPDVVSQCNSQSTGIIKDVFLDNVVVRLVHHLGGIWAYFGETGITQKYIPIGGCYIEKYESNNPKDVIEELKKIKHRISTNTTKESKHE